MHCGMNVQGSFDWFQFMKISFMASFGTPTITTVECLTDSFRSHLIHDPRNRRIIWMNLQHKEVERQGRGGEKSRKAG